MLLRHLTLARYESRQFNNCRFVWKLRRRRFLVNYQTINGIMDDFQLIRETGELLPACPRPLP
ncbi:MAG: hypothetical protein ACYDBJ_21280, partial [Aggregatilineales bacterium]